MREGAVLGTNPRALRVIRREREREDEREREPTRGRRP